MTPELDPQTYFEQGFSKLLKEDFHQSLDCHLKGLRTSKEKWSVLTLTKKLITFHQTIKTNTNLDLLISTCLLYLATTYSDKWASTQLNVKLNIRKKDYRSPIVILAGSTSSNREKNLSDFEENLGQSFKNFKGTIISGGTTSGISGIAGKIQKLYPRSIQTIGYTPNIIPDSRVKIDSRYSQIIKSDGNEFSILESLCYWNDLFHNQVSFPHDVKLIGFGGGEIARFEYRMALLLNIKVGLVENSGREALKLLQDPFWRNDDKSQKLLYPINNSRKTLEDFILDID